MFEDLSDLHDTLLALRLVREEIHAEPVAPAEAARLRDALLSENAPPGGAAALRLAVARGRDAGTVGSETLAALAEAAGNGGLRTHPGTAFRGRGAPAPARVPDLLAELLETVNSPLAVESWPPPVRAFALHFFLRLVQPYEAPAATVAFAAEAMVLASDGFRADLTLLAEPDVGSEPGAGKPDPEAFVRARAHRFLERAAESRERVRHAAARSLLAAWADRREARLNRRQAHLVKLLAAGEPGRRVVFQDYVDLHAGRRAPSLRSLQRDFQGLRERGLLRRDGEAWTLDARPLQFGA